MGCGASAKRYIKDEAANWHIAEEAAGEFMADEPPGIPQVQQRKLGEIMQAEGHAEVAIRDTPEGTIVAMIPNGEYVIILQQEGEFFIVQWKGFQGWAKQCNVQERSSVAVLGADPIGFWEYKEDGKWLPYSREESTQLDFARENVTEFSINVGPNKLSCMVTFQVDEDGSIKRGKQTSRPAGRIRDIRREASAKELVQKARSVMEECMQEPPDVGVPKYTQPDSVREILRRKTEPVKLLRGSWVTRYAGREGQLKGLPRRQDLEQGAFLTSSEVVHIAGGSFNTLNIFSISYCWRAWNHPDADGKQLRAIESELTVQMTGPYWLKANFKDAGIFWDFCSLHQKDHNGRRTDTEWNQFNEALSCMDIWYMHTWIFTFIVNGNWTHELGIDYEDRGWTHFERSCAELIKPFSPIGNENCPMSREFGESGRKLPVSPELFAEGLAQRRFTSRGDKEKVVALYTKACMLALRGTKRIHLRGIKLQRHECKQLGSVLQHCCCVEDVGLLAMDINDDDVCVILATLQNCTSLRTLCLDENKIGDFGAKLIAEALPRMSNLQRLGLSFNSFTQIGTNKLEKAWADAGKYPTLLEIDGPRLRQFIL